MTRGRARRPVARRHGPRHRARPETGGGGARRGGAGRRGGGGGRRPETGAGDAQRVRRDVAGVALLPCTRELLQAETRSNDGGRHVLPRTRELLQFKLESRYRGGDGGCLDASKVLKSLTFDLA